jgi:antitoxin component of RelBE/YafQ-DinJ toxin-antitoxin module
MKEGIKEVILSVRIDGEIKEELKDKAKTVFPSMKISEYVRLLILKDLGKV